ncbi:MAG: DUF4199 domain-containing protein [Flavobacteriales bacterium]|nr:DUF4199 domain-containing protein [Flavobacteriales bacterium]
MTEKPMSQMRIALFYGGIFGLISVASSLIFYMLGLFGAKGTGWVGYILMIGMIVIAIKNYRDQHLNGYISYGHSLGTGVLVSVIGGLIGSLFMFLMLTVIDPELMDFFKQQAESQALERNPSMTDEELAQAMKAAEMFMSPVVFFVAGVIGSAFMGLLFSLIISIFLQKKSDQMPMA